ncbi:MAG: 4-(cytidine 5'-diphospho)-2-C-methyl-D-erythritol kinase [Solirubrobacterales bacterium]
MTTVEAPAKINLCLYLGPRLEDGYHLIASLFEPVTLSDSLTFSEAERDEVVCPGVEGENLATRALRVLRSEGWEAPPMRIEIEKRIPVAAGLGGGSADAAAVLRQAAGEVGDIGGIAALIGADVPSQIDPMACLVEGIGQKITSLPRPAEHWVVLLATEPGLATPEVFERADRMELSRKPGELPGISERLWAVASNGVSPLEYPGLLVNDLEPAAISLMPRIAEAKDRLADAGAGHVGMSGSGPTVFGLFPDREEAERAARDLGPEAILCEGGVAESG